MPDRRLATHGAARRARCLAVALLALAAGSPVAAAEQAVRLDLGDGLQAGARYFAARPDRPAVLLVHDFLGTPYGLPVRALADRLAREGVDLLAPALSLGISLRRDPLACTALHTHVFERDVREIRLWVDWLLGQGRTRIVLAGFGYGAWQALAVTREPLSGAVRAVVMISPRAPRADDPAALRAGAGGGDGALLVRPLWDCERFAAPADTLYSYARQDAPGLLELLRAAPVPVRAIVGDEGRVDAGWRARLAGAGAALKYVPRASDFSDSRHLGALMELLVASLKIEG